MIKRFLKKRFSFKTSDGGVSARFFSPLCVLCILAACTSTDTPLAQPTGGYSAIVFTQYTKVRDHAFNVYSFNAGTRLVADRQTRTGRMLYCGHFNINDDLKPYNGCLGFEAPSTLIIGVGAGFKEVRRPQPEGTIKIETHRI